jgi:hypothetical protein
VYLVEIFLPVNDNEGHKHPLDLFFRVRQELVARFGGLTAFTRNPAKGIWEGQCDGRREDELIIYEVMVQTLDQRWWRDYKSELEARFRQVEVIVRASPMDLL